MGESLDDWYFSGLISLPNALGIELGFGLGSLLSSLDLLDSELGFGLGSALGTRLGTRLGGLELVLVSVLVL